MNNIFEAYDSGIRKEADAIFGGVVKCFLKGFGRMLEEFDYEDVNGAFDGKFVEVS